MSNLAKVASATGETEVEPWRNVAAPETKRDEKLALLDDNMPSTVRLPACAELAVKSDEKDAEVPTREPIAPEVADMDEEKVAAEALRVSVVTELVVNPPDPLRVTPSVPSVIVVEPNLMVLLSTAEAVIVPEKLAEDP